MCKRGYGALVGQFTRASWRKLLDSSGRVSHILIGLLVDHTISLFRYHRAFKLGKF